MRYAISGAAGFIGSHVCDVLTGEGHEIVALDNFITGNLDNVAHLLKNPRFHVIEHDVTQPLPAFGPVDRVLHMASLASPIDYLKHPIETLESGSTGTRN